MSTTHSPNHLKPGQPMQHDDHGVGIVANTYISGLGIHYATYTGHAGLTRDFTGWKPLETCTWQERQWLDYRGGVECICDTNPATTGGPSEECEIHGRRYSEWVERATEAEKEQELTDIVKPGHVQVRVDDLNKNGLRRLGNREEEPNTNTHAQWNAATRVGKAWAAQQAESHNAPANSETVTDPGGPSLTTTVSLPCPDCGETITREARVFPGSPGEYYITWTGLNWHECKRAQPDEPQEFGARVTVTTPDGRVEKWVRADGYTYPWRRVGGYSAGWAGLTQHGQVSLGWDDAQ